MGHEKIRSLMIFGALSAPKIIADAIEILCKWIHAKHLQNQGFLSRLGEIGQEQYPQSH